jgi:PHD/YefM family antitoxin component YafN of YafNO toxin-antitoxin module
MKTKAIASTEAQNNFGRILNDVIQHHTRYVIKRHDLPQAIVLSLVDLEKLLTNVTERSKMVNIIRDITPIYNLGESISPDES